MNNFFEFMENQYAVWKITDSDEFTETYRCSRCGHEVSINIEIYREELPDFCPSCGARAER